MRTAGNANVVKNAVAPAILNGSFLLNPSKALLSRTRIFIRFLNTIIDLIENRQLLASR